MRQDLYTDFDIAGIRLRLTNPAFVFRGLMPFARTGLRTPDIEVRNGYVPDERPRRLIDTFGFPDADADCRLEHDGDTHRFTITPRSGGKTVHFLICANPGGTCRIVTDFIEGDNPALFRFGLWMACNICAAERGISAVHASVVICKGGAALFLGESGTGKSTHTRLWLEHVPGAELLNDDSPMVAVHGGEAMVYGSPWSGKTPCFRNEAYPVRAFVRLAQAAFNRIERLSLLQAYGALQPSFPPSFINDERLFDRTNALLSELLTRIPVYRLDCLPNADAAWLVHDTVFGNPTAPER